MGDEAVAKIGVMMEQLGARFDLVVEAVTGYGGRIEQLRDDIVGQFAEVGRQIRFLSDQIALNRGNLGAMRSDLGAEIVRLGETLGATRVEFRAQLASETQAIRGEIEQAVSRMSEALGVAEEVGAEADAQAGKRAGAIDARRALSGEVSAAADSVVRKLGAELKAAGKTLAALNRKFDRFDDRITVQTRDQDQRLRKLERKAR